MNIYEVVTDRIISKMQEGIIPWVKPWNMTKTYTFDTMSDFTPAYSYSTGKPYDIINQMLLGFREGEYATFNQIAKAGGKVKKGEKSFFVVGWIVEKKQKVKDGTPVVDENGNPELETHFGLRYYHVFDILTQVEGIKPKHEWTKVEPKKVTKPKKTEKKVERIESAEALIRQYLGSKDHPAFHSVKSDRAFYRPSEDSVTIPLPEQFKSIEHYYATAFHELTHSTGKDTRCDRHLEKISAFGDGVYSKEELVAEIGSCFLCNVAGVCTDKVFENSVAYLQSWLKALKDDPKMIVYASAQAQKAVEYIMNA